MPAARRAVRAVPGGVPKKLTAGQAARVLASITPSDAVQAARCELAAEFTENLRGIDARIRDTRKAGHRGPRGRDQPDRAARGRPGDRRRGHLRRPHGVQLFQPGSLRRLQRHRPHRGVLGRAEGTPVVPPRQPPPQPHHPHDRGRPDPPSPQLLSAGERVLDMQPKLAAPAAPTTRNWPRARPPRHGMAGSRRGRRILSASALPSPRPSSTAQSAWLSRWRTRPRWTRC